MVSQSGEKRAHKTDDEEDVCAIGSLEGKSARVSDSVLSEKLYPAIAILNTVGTRSEHGSAQCLQCRAFLRSWREE